MAKKAKTTSRAKLSSVKLKRRNTAVKKRNEVMTRALGGYVIPSIVLILLLGVTAYVGSIGYAAATTSDFFHLKDVEVYGSQRTSVEEIKRVVVSGAEKPGVWNADLSDIRLKIEKFPFIKSASVSRILPSGIRVNVVERLPAAVVQLSSGPYLVDSEGAILVAVKGEQKEFPFVLRGWDETKTEAAIPENKARLKIYKKMLDEWRQFDIAARVREVNIANPREPVAVVEDSGRPIAVTLPKDNFGINLKTAIDAVAGKGAKVKSVDAAGVFPVINYIEF